MDSHARPSTPARILRRWGTGQVGAVGLVLGGALSVHFGSAVAALLFPRAGVAGTVTLRLAIGALLMLLVCRPRLRGYGRGDWASVVLFGLALAGMNSVFYQAIERIPLGPAVTLEVLGPLTLSVLTAHRWTAWCWAGLALAGVALLGQGGFDRLNPVGGRFPRADGLALAMTVAALLTLPFGLADAGTRLWHPAVLALGAGLALLASVLPYTLELLALRRLATSTFAVLMSLGPALAALAGWLVLGQDLHVTEVLAIALVVAASIGAVRAGTPRTPDRPEHPAAAPAGPVGTGTDEQLSAATAPPPARR